MKCLSLIFFLLSTNLLATTWVNSEVNDPFNQNAKCMVEEPASSGSYIYQWPSKYDQVYWPLTTMRGIWYCQSSGYISLMGDFDGLTETEINKIQGYLQENKFKLTTVESKLKRLEIIYSFRDKNAEFDNRLKRILAYLYEEDGNTILANQYRALALEEILIALQGDLKDFNQLEYLYLATNYHRQLGKIEKSDSYMLKLIETIKNNSNDELQGYKDYLSKLIEDSKYIKKGGVLNPTLPQDDA
ncbi:MAG: hypothetical protein COA74_09220 [Gammaproteobacteria bacterium]|nr:MAG: hypothetical protein COA74_09220 [Gammaproteobacteria bacterium]